MFQSKKKGVIVLVLLCLFSFYIGGIYKDHVYYKKDSQYVINDLRSSFNRINDDLDYIIKKTAVDPKNKKAINHTYKDLIKELNELESNMFLFRRLMTKYDKDDLVALSDMEFAVHDVLLILQGVTTNGKTISHDFLEDDMLTKEEVDFLIKIKDELIAIEDKFIDDETGQTDKTITMAQLKHIFEPFTGDFIDSIIYESINNW